MIRLIVIVWLALLSTAAHATPLVGDLSQYRIEMDASFNGTRVFIFGARNDIGDVVVAVRGPQKHFMVRKKEPIAGIWINRGRMKFFDVPSFYAIASSKPLGDIHAELLLGRLSLGQERLLPPPASPLNLARHQEYAEAFLHHQQQRRLYNAAPISLQFMGETLFKATIEFPDTIPPGEYTAEIYLIQEDRIMGMQTIPIHVTKSGLDAFLYRYAHESPFLYGITAIIMALTAGWFAGRLFEKS